MNEACLKRVTRICVALRHNVKLYTGASNVYGMGDFFINNEQQWPTKTPNSGQDEAKFK